MREGLVLCCWFVVVFVDIVVVGVLVVVGIFVVCIVDNVVFVVVELIFFVKCINLKKKISIVLYVD